MEYSLEHLVVIYILGVVSGVISTLLFSRKGIDKEGMVSLLIIGIWLSMHVIGFFTDREVSWLMDFAGFGAVGNFTGINLFRFAKGVVDVKKNILK